MNSISNHDANINSRLLFLLAVCAGLGVANVYYLQPALHLVQMDFNVSAEAVGLVPTLTQIGYAGGMFLLAPLGDILPRRKLIMFKSLLLSVALAAAGFSADVHTLTVACIAIGLLSSVGQDFVPVAAQLSSELRRGHTVSIVTTGLLTGILLSRTLGGIVAQYYGWRSMQFLAAGMMVMVALMVRNSLPALPATQINTSYLRLIGSLLGLFRQHRSLRRSIFTQALLASTLGAFWSTLAMVLAAPPYEKSATIAGAFGIAGAAGACAASIFGRVADARGPLPAIRLGCLMVIIAFAGMWILPKSLFTLAAGAVVFDMGVMAALVSHQLIINSIDPRARSRLNGLLMTGAMCGMAIGAAAGSFMWSKIGWTGICLLCISASILGLLLSFSNNPAKDGAYTHD